MKTITPTNKNTPKPETNIFGTNDGCSIPAYSIVFIFYFITPPPKQTRPL